MKESIKKIGSWIAIILCFYWLGRRSHFEQHTLDDLEVKVVSTKQVKDSLLVENRIIQVKHDIDSLEIIKRDSTIAQIESEREQWKVRYKAMAYTHKVLIAEGLVGGHIVIKDGLACFNEPQLDSINYIGRERDDLVNVLEEMNDVFELKDNLIAYKEKQKRNLQIALDTTLTEVDSLRIVGLIYLNNNKILEVEVVRQRKHKRIAGGIALAYIINTGRKIYLAIRDL